MPEPSSRQRLNPKNRSKKVARLVTSEVVRVRCLSCMVCHPFRSEERTKTEPMLTGEPNLSFSRPTGSVTTSSLRPAVGPLSGRDTFPLLGIWPGLPIRPCLFSAKVV